VPDSQWAELTTCDQATLPGLDRRATAPGANTAAAHTLARRALPAEPGVWDELRADGNQLRPAWQRFAQHLPPPASAAGMAEDLGQRVGQVHQRIRQDGVTHNVFADVASSASISAPTSTSTSATPTNAARPWSLELLPLLVEADDWAQIEAGVVQRAALLEHMLADLYGPQTLLARGLLPPALLHRHPGWLPQLQGVAPAGGKRLYIVAFDLARGPDGRWWLVSQRTQGPSGLGYVLHNRLLIARQFPDAFRALRVQRIAPAYRRLLNTLEAQAATVVRPGQGAPRVVLLTPGPYSETYFEHAYLARYLGLPLVEGGDLTVRGEHLFLKTVEGLEPVHGVMRRLDDDWCDPLELRPGSTLGVPGLLQAARAGTVVMANALGSGFLESPAVQGFMPGVAQQLLGQPLLLPSLPTWWCGEAAAFAHVQTQLAGKVLRSTYPRGGRTTQMHDLKAHNPDDVHHSALQEDPDAWTIQARLRFSRAPIWQAGAVQPRPAVLRVYAMADSTGGWHVMPGGMTRVAQREDASLSMQRGGSSLDTWVLAGPSTTPSNPPAAAGPAQPDRLRVADIAQHRRPVSSRTGENLFWLGRYTERTEQLVRLARATLAHSHTEREAPVALQQALAQLAAQTGLVPPPAVPGLAPAGAATRSVAQPAHSAPPAQSAQSAYSLEASLLLHLASSGANSTGSAPSIAYNLLALERAAQSLRDRLSPEQWSLVRSLHDSFVRSLQGAPGGPASAAPSPAQALAALDHLGLQLAALTGAQTDRMTRDHGWRLLTVGRLLERLHGVALLLQAFVAGPALQRVAGVELLLDLFDSLITFRARYQRHDELLALTDVLVLDPTNPRAFAGVLRRLRTEMAKLPGSPQALAPLLALLPSDGAGLQLQELQGMDDTALALRLHTLAGGLASAAHQVADGVSALYFTLAHGADQRV
jgi:uncharacterized circularly permuted ATP-grasp superfamily protein/uncharacterized alpha-E superfamily protein